MFVVFRRACAPADEPGATVTRDARAATLRDRRVLDVPKLVDLCAIYGPDNPAAVALLARDAATLVPNLDRALADAGARPASGLETTADRLAAAAFEDGALDENARDDALRYFHDVAVSLAALVRAHPPFAEALLRGGAGTVAVARGTDEARNRRNRKGKAVMMSEDAHVASDGSTVNPNLNPNPNASIDPRHAAPGALLEAIDRAAHETTPLLSGVGDGGAVVAAAADATTRALDAPRRLLADPPELDPRVGSNLDGVSSASTASASGPDPALAAAVAQVRAIFPDHGDGFLALALERFGGDPEACAANLLEGHLPPELAKVDTKTPWPPPGLPTPGVPTARAPAPRGALGRAQTAPARAAGWRFHRRRAGSGTSTTGWAGTTPTPLNGSSPIWSTTTSTMIVSTNSPRWRRWRRRRRRLRGGIRRRKQQERRKRQGRDVRPHLGNRRWRFVPESSGKGGAPRTFWIADGRVYHAPKEARRR